MIGILLALQVSDWNQARKDRGQEIELLQDVVDTLELNQQMLEGYISLIDRSNQSTEIILSAIENKTDYDGSLDKSILHSFEQWSQSFVSEVGFEGLKNAGLDIVQSDTLRKELVNLFENTYPIRRENIEVWQTDQQILKYMDENFTWHGEDISDKDSMSPKDWNAVMNDDYFYSILKRLSTQRMFIQNNQRECLEETVRILALVNAELAERGMGGDE